MALVISLSLLVLVTFAAMAFFIRATANRSIESSRANQVLAIQMATTAADYVAGQFLQEIAAHSTSITTNGITIFQPASATFATPQRALPASAPFNTDNFSNLVRRSVNESVNGAGETNASTHSTTTPSRNGRVAGMERWNAPALLSGGGFSAASQLPNWVYLNTDGTATATPSANAIGRFAYNAYTIGGLLDANVVGYPTSISPGTAEFSAIKSTLAGADLSLIPGISDPGAFASWRNANHIATSTSYVMAVTDTAKTGFLRPGVGDQRIASRQDLIRLARQGTQGITTDALPFLTAFSRTPDGPSFTPDPARPQVVTQVPALPTVGLDDEFNPSLLGTRVTTAFTRADGSTAKTGEPLLKKKFPLSRLALLENAPAVVAAGSDVYKFFGLTRTSSSDPWIYNHGQPDAIFKLDEVADAGREPDFFELLQACIPIGSLGKSLGKTSAYVTAPGDDVARDIYSKYQILQIGANLIDQYDADSYPSAIQLMDGNDFVFSGIENLPYLTRIFTTTYRNNRRTIPYPTATDPPTDVEDISYFLQPEVWNPHQNGSNGLSEFRFVMEGQSDLIWKPGTSQKIDTGEVFTVGSRDIAFSGTTNLQSPRLLDLPIGTASDPKDTVTTPDGTTFVGMLVGKQTVPYDGFASTTEILVVPAPSFSYYLQYRRGSQWITYGGMLKHMHRYIFGPTWVEMEAYPSPIRGFIARSDPRVNRFGFMLAYNYGDPGAEPNTTLRPSYTSDGCEVWDNSQQSQHYPGWHPHTPAGPYAGWLYGYYLGLLTENRPTSTTWYEDPDGQNRLGDAALSSGRTANRCRPATLPVAQLS